RIGRVERAVKADDARRGPRRCGPIRAPPCRQNSSQWRRCARGPSICASGARPTRRWRGRAAECGRFCIFRPAPTRSSGCRPGSLLYAGCFIVLGVLFSHQLEQVIVALASLGRSALGLVVGLVALYIGYKYYQRQRLLKELRMARITVDELHQKLETGENPIILDLRSHAELERDPSLIRGARHMTMEEVKLRQHEIPRDRDIILY